MSQPIIPITTHVAQAAAHIHAKAPWRISNSVSRRMELKPSSQDSSFKKCLILSSDSEMAFIEKYFSADKPQGMKIRRVYCIENTNSDQAFEAHLSQMEAETKKSQFDPGWSEASSFQARNEVFQRWQSMTQLFPSFELKDGGLEINQAKVLPLWLRGKSEEFFSILKTFDSIRETSSLSNDSLTATRGSFGSGIYFTNSIRYASIHSPDHLLLAWVSMREPYPVVHEQPHPGLGGDRELLIDKKEYQNYNAHHIPVALINSPNSDEYYACYQNQDVTSDEFIVFNQAQVVSRLWVQLGKKDFDSSYSLDEAMACAEDGSLSQLERWVQEDRNRIFAKTLEGETLAYAALSGNQLQILRWLASQDPSLINHIRGDGKSLPFLAVLGQRKDILNFLMDKGVTYSSSQFTEEAKRLGYSKDRIARALNEVNWSTFRIPCKTLHFTGRESLLSEIKERIFLSSFQSPTHVALVGLGGMGKSALAAAYAHQFQSCYSLIWWIEAEKSPRSGLKDLGIELGLAKTDTPEEEALKEVFSYLSKNPGWLLIFDNGGSPSTLQPLFPLFGKGHILIASQDTTWTNSLPVSSFSPGESLSLLGKYTGYPSNKEGEKLTEELGHFPLALTQAGAYMAETATSYKSYLDLYLQGREKFISSHSFSGDYPYSIATTWKISLDQLKITSPESLPILYQALYLAPDKIPKSFLSDEGLSSSRLDNSLKILRNYSLLTTREDPETFSIHRLVQITLRDYLSPDGAERAKKTVRETFEKEWSFDLDVPSTWVKAKTLLSHLEAFSTLGADDETAGRFWHDLGTYFLQVEKNPTSSIDFLNKSLQIRKKIYGEEHPDVAASLNNLGFAYQAKGDLPKAIESLTQALQVREKVYGKEHPDVAASLNNLGNAYQAKGNLPEAIEALTRALQIREKVYGKEHLLVLNSLNNLGNAYKAQGNLREAIEFLTRALQIREKVYGKEHPLVATSLTNLGIIYQAKGNFPLALEFLTRGLEIYRKVYGEEHPLVATSFFELGNTYRAEGNLPLAIEFLTKGLEVYQKVYGEEHPDVAASLNNLGTVYKVQGDLPLAIECLTRGLKIYKKIYGKEHPHIETILNNLGTIYQAAGDLSKAIEFYSQSLQVGKKVYGKEHEKVGEILHVLALAHLSMMSLEISIDFLSESLMILRKTLKDDDPRVRDVLETLSAIIWFEEQRRG